MSENLTIRLSLPIGLPFVTPCFFNDPGNCTFPGVGIEFLKFYGDYRNFTPMIEEASEFGIGHASEGNNSAMKLLVSGAIDMLGPHFWFIYERSSIPGIKLSPPLGYDELL